MFFLHVLTVCVCWDFPWLKIMQTNRTLKFEQIHKSKCVHSLNTISSIMSFLFLFFFTSSSYKFQNLELFNVKYRDQGRCVTCLLFCRQQPQQLVSIMSQSEWDSHFRSLRILQILQQQKMPRAASPPAACLNNVSLNVSMSHSSLSSSLSQFVSKLWNCLIQFNKIFLQIWNVGISQGYADTKQVFSNEYRFDD